MSDEQRAAFDGWFYNNEETLLVGLEEINSYAKHAMYLAWLAATADLAARLERAKGVVKEEEEATRRRAEDRTISLEKRLVQIHDAACATSEIKSMCLAALSPAPDNSPAASKQGGE